jgi:microcystin-dependent protein
MAQPYIGEIRMFGGNFAPAGWAFCDGQLVPISEYDALFALIGTTYGGDGESTFALPDLRGRIPIHMGAGFVLGETAGAETVTLTVNQIPIHGHPMVASSSFGSLPTAQSNLLAKTTNIDLYSGFPADTPFAASAVVPVGGSQPHNNLQPYLCVDFIISLYGIFPTQT